MQLDELEYHLPKEQIAQRPLDRREAWRLLLLDRATGRFEDHLFLEVFDFLRGNELLVLNNARVIADGGSFANQEAPPTPAPDTSRCKS